MNSLSNTIPEVDFTNIDNMNDPAITFSVTDYIRLQKGVIDLKTQALTIFSPKSDSRILDVGCGTGEDVRQLSHAVGDQGYVIGVDKSEVMIAEAIKRSKDYNNIKFQTADIEHLDFNNETFDGCWCERVLQHLDDPRRAISEMTRILKHGSKLVILDTDWETFVIDAPNRSITRVILNLFCDDLRNGWIGRQLSRICKEASMTDITPFASVVDGNDYRLLFSGLGLGEITKRAVEQSLITQESLDKWMNDIKEADIKGQFFYSVTMFGVCATKPHSYKL
jgi:ubiquinone/menaquinone biosynthesis C-methylase UbiE